MKSAVTSAASGDRLAPARAAGLTRDDLLRRVRDYSQVVAKGECTNAVVDDALKLEGVDHLGLDELDRSYLRTIGNVYSGGPVGLETVAATMNEDAGTLEDVVEPFLLQTGFLARTRRGRALTKAACDHLKIKFNPDALDKGAGDDGVTITR